jgi:hypothetical protein
MYVLPLSNLIKYALPGLRLIRPLNLISLLYLSMKKLISDDPYRIEIHSQRQRTGLKDLRCHIGRRATAIILDFGVDRFADAHIGDAHVPLRIDYEVFGFYVAVQDAVLVQVLQGY